MSKYNPLKDHLKTQKINSLTLTFSEIEEIIKGKLPSSEFDSLKWWDYLKEIKIAGFKVVMVDLEKKSISLRRVIPIRLNNVRRVINVMNFV